MRSAKAHGKQGDGLVFDPVCSQPRGMPAGWANWRRLRATGEIRAAVRSEDQPCRELNKTGRGCIDDLAKGAVADVAVYGSGSKELCVIERIKDLRAQFKRFSFCDPHLLLQGGVEVFDSRSGKVTPSRIAHRAQIREAEERGIERRVAAARIEIEVEVDSVNGLISDSVATLLQQPAHPLRIPGHALCQH